MAFLNTHSRFPRGVAQLPKSEENKVSLWKLFITKLPSSCSSHPREADIARSSKQSENPQVENGKLTLQQAGKVSEILY